MQLILQMCQLQEHRGVRREKMHIGALRTNCSLESRTGFAVVAKLLISIADTPDWNEWSAFSK